jgi:hypothetical protein
MASLSFINLTSVRQDAAQLAELAVEAAAERLDGGRMTSRDIVLDPVLPCTRHDRAAPAHGKTQQRWAHRPSAESGNLCRPVSRQ